jgi:hypothetical protein
VAAIRDAGMRAVNLGSIPTPALTCYAHLLVASGKLCGNRVKQRPNVIR